MPTNSQDTTNQQQRQDTNYPGYVLMHNQPYSEFTYDNTLMNESALTPLPEPEYVRQQEDVFSELISLANHRQHMAQSHLPSSAYSYSTKPPTSHHHHSLPTTAGPSSSSISSSSSTVAPTTWEQSSQERHYELKVIQQPYRARMCGFGDKDRRPISPPPILQLITRTKDGQIIKPESIDISFFIVLCDSWHEDGTTEANLVYHSFSSPQQSHQKQSKTTLDYQSSPSPSANEDTTKTLQMRNLVGSSVASAAKLYDLDGHLGIFFVFQDISFRTEGKFKLAFSLINVGSPCGNTVNTTSSSQVLTRVFTDMFTVFTAKKFPGVVRSTPLSQCFAKQGVKIPIRKDTQVKRKKSTKKGFSAFAMMGHDDDQDDIDEDDNDDDGDGSHLV
ncbi:velvet factor-domain-containing protein [Chlamydoabsidia padenii]|nr:velvet factor-domain-containing protein [Chlamydoabsidia padenii]